MLPAKRRHPNSLANLKPKWAKGQSGNLAGRPPIPRDVVAAAQAKSLEAITTLVDIREDPEVPPGVRMSACKVLLDRAWGKPHRVAVAVEAPDSASLDFNALSVEELAMLESLLSKAMRGSASDVSH